MPGFDAQGNYLDDEGNVLLPANPILSSLSGRYGPASAPEMNFPPADLRTGSDAAPLSFPPADLRGVPPEFDIPGKKVFRLPTSIQEVKPEGSLPQAAAVSSQGDALGHLLGMGKNLGGAMQAGAQAQTARQAAEQKSAPWGRGSTFGQRVDLSKEEQALSTEQEARLAAEKANYAVENERRANKLDVWRKDEQARLFGEWQDWKKMEVDPHKAFGDRSFVENAMGVLGALMGSLVKNGPNPAMEIINRVVEQSIDAQKANIDKAGAGLQQGMNLYQINLANRMTDEQAFHQTKAMLFDALATEFSTRYSQKFADRELQQQAKEQFDALEEQSRKSLEEAAMASEKHIYEMAGNEADIRVKLTQAGKNEAEIQKILGDLKGAGGGAAVSPQKTGAGFANESEIFAHFGFDKAGNVPPTLGDPFRPSGGGVVTEISTPGRDGAESVWGSLGGKALLEDKEAVRKLRDEAGSWNELYRVYLSLERSMLDREVPWDEEAVKNKQLAARAGLAELSQIKGAASESDWKLVQQAMGDALNPNKIRDMRDPAARRQVFETLQHMLDSRIDSALSSYSHTRVGKDGKTYEFRVRWQPPQAGITPQGSKNTDAEAKPAEVKQMLRSGSLDQILKGSNATIDNAGQALGSGDLNGIRLAREEVTRQLHALRIGGKAMERAEGDVIIGPYRAAPAKVLEKRIADLQKARRTERVDAKERQMFEEQVGLEARLEVLKENKRGGSKARVAHEEARFTRLLKQLEQREKELGAAEAAGAARSKALPSLEEMGMQ